MSYPKEKVGRLLKIGGEHLVYQYGEDQVIKFPNLLARVLFNQQKLAEKKKADLQLAKKYFSDYLLATEYLPLINSKYSYCLIQPKVLVRPLLLKDLENKYIKEQFLAIIAINDIIKEQEKVSFDFLGAWRLILNGLVSNKSINNLMITNNEKIIILDTVFLEYQSCAWSKLLYFISRWAERKQTKVLSYFLNSAYGDGCKTMD